MVDRELVRGAFSSPEWRAVSDELSSALGLTISIVDIAAGVTIHSGRPVFPCDIALDTQPIPGLACLRRTERVLDERDPEPIRGVCEAGVRAILTPVMLDGRVVCHVMASGFLASTNERARLANRLGRGMSASDAQEVVARLPLVERDRAECIGQLLAKRAARFLTDAETLVGPDAREREIILLAEVARDLGPIGQLYGRIPETSLGALLAASGGDRAMVWLTDRDESEPRLAAEIGPDSDAAAELAVRSAVAHVLTTGRSLLTTLPGARAALLAVPVPRQGKPGGAIVLTKPKARSLRAGDVRVAELFGEAVGVMLDNSHEFYGANMRLVELLQANEVSQALNSTLDYDRLSELATQVLAKQLNFEAGGFIVEGFGDVRGRLVHEVDLTRGEISELLAEAGGSGDAGPAAAALPPALVIVGKDATLLESTAEGLASDWTVLSREIRFRNVRAGELFVASRQQSAFNADDERVLEVLAAHLSIALQNSVLYERLRDDFGRAIAALGALADATERLEHGHTDRVMDYAVALGREMRLPIQRIGLLRFAGLLHDLGKVGLAEEILVKPSVLTPDEMELVRRHSETGASIIEQVRTLEEIAPIVRHHHEHWDGAGYPDGLAGEAIPLEARILSVADAYEAMTGKRVHRKRMAPAAAREELSRNSGTQFDPAVVDAFLRLLDRQALAGGTGLFADLASDSRGPRLPA